MPPTRLSRAGRLRVALLGGTLLALAPVVAPSALADANPFELEVVTLLNQERSLLGVAALGTDVRLFQSTEGHAVWMAANDRLSHSGSSGGTAATRAEAAGYVDWTRVGETLAAGHETPAEVVLGRTCDSWCSTSCQSGRCDGWKQSPSHWTILMNGAYRDIGVGYVHDPSAGDPYHHWWALTVANSTTAATPVGGGTSVTDTPQPTATRTPPPTATRTPRPTATGTPPATATRTPGPTDTPKVPTTTLRPTDSPPSTATRTRVPTATRTSTPTATRTSAPTALPSSTRRPSEPTSTPPPAGGAGPVLVGRVRLQTRGTWAGTEILVDGRPSAVTGEDGWLAILGLAPGRHVLEARQDGYLSSRRTVEVPPGVVTHAGEALLVTGDASRDNRIDLLDWVIVASDRGRCAGEPGYRVYVDVDRSGCVGEEDLAIVTENLGRVGPTSWAPVPAP